MPAAPLRGVAAAVLLAAIAMPLAVAGPLLLWDGGCFEEETTHFVRQYTAQDGRSVLQKVFDPHANDIGTYQARELSYLIDLADAYAYPHLARLIEPGFSLPLSSLAASIGIVVLVAAGLRHHAARLGPLNSTLLLACFLTSFCFVSTMGLFYRSAKPVLAAVVVAWVLVLLRIVRRRSGGSAGIFFLTLAAGLLDRQGVYLAMVAAVLLGMHAWRTRTLRDVAVAAIAAVVLLQVYGFLLAPVVIHALNGYWPDFSYQRLPAGEIVRLPRHVVRAVSLLAQNTLLVFGGNWIVSGTIAALAIGMMVRRPVRRLPAGGVAFYAGLVLLSQIGMFALMIARHGPVYGWIDHRFWYYPLPFLALLLWGLLLALDRRVATAAPRLRRALPLVLAVAVVSNVLSLGHRREVMAGGPWFGQVYPQCELLKASLREGRPDPGLNGAYRLLFDHSMRAQQSHTTR